VAQIWSWKETAFWSVLMTYSLLVHLVLVQHLQHAC